MDVALEVPLGAFPVGRLLQRDDAGTAGVEVFHEPLDRAALARRIPALEHDDVPVAVGLAPLLQLEQFDLQQPFLLLVLVTRHALVIRVVLPPRVDGQTVGAKQNGVVIVVVVHTVAV